MDSNHIQQIDQQIAELYLQDKRPWILGYSGGKDSTMIVQLIFYAIQKVPIDQRTKPIYVLSSDTLVESPPIVQLMQKNLRQMETAAKRRKMPLTTHMVRPEVNETFWVNLIGRGYPAPTRSFRWCTERMKIKPADRFIMEQVSTHGEAIVVLGTRRAESATRAQAMALYSLEGTFLKRHSTLPNAFVYAPIEFLKTDEVWAYLLQVPNPWGADNHNLLSLYRSTQAGECPLVVDTTTPSCGNSRFGCWTCTVVERDRSMEGMIQSGQDWMEPLLEFRDFLSETGDPEKKHLYRDHRRLGGQITITKRDTIAYGPYKFPVSNDILRRLLTIQKQLKDKGLGDDATLISQEELLEIRKIWRTERQDWKDSLPQIYKDVFGEDFECPRDDATSFSGEDMAVLDGLCQEHGVPTQMVAKLLDLERQVEGMGRRSSIFQKIEKVLAQDWRTEDEVKASLPSRNAKTP